MNNTLNIFPCTFKGEPVTIKYCTIWDKRGHRVTLNTPLIINSGIGERDYYDDNNARVLPYEIEILWLSYCTAEIYYLKTSLKHLKEFNNKWRAISSDKLPDTFIIGLLPSGGVNFYFASDNLIKLYSTEKAEKMDLPLDYIIPNSGFNDNLKFCRSFLKMNNIKINKHHFDINYECRKYIINIICNNRYVIIVKFLNGEFLRSDSDLKISNIILTTPVREISFCNLQEKYLYQIIFDVQEIMYINKDIRNTSNILQLDFSGNNKDICLITANDNIKFKKITLKNINLNEE